MTGPGRRRAAIAGAAALLGALIVLIVVLVSNSSSPRHPAHTTQTTQTTHTTVARSESTTTALSTTTASTLAAPATALPAPRTEGFGASVNLLFNTPGLADSLIAAQLHALRAAGATVARSDALWEASERTAPSGGVHHYDWTFDDRIAADLAMAGLRWLPILDYTAPWAQSIPGQDHSPPRSDDDYAAYAGAFAARYGPGGTFWRAHPELTAPPVDTIEIWNEPDNGQFWAPTPDAGAYADLYASARLAIDAVTPTVRVIIGGLTRPPEFLAAMLAARPALAGHIDGVGVHPYGRPGVVRAKLADDRAALVASGLGAVALYATEFGWTTSPPGALDYVAAARRPAYIRDTLDALGGLRCGVVEAVLYTWYSPEQNPTDSQQWYGISGPAGAPTPDTTAFSDGVREALAAAPRDRAC